MGNSKKTPLSREEAVCRLIRQAKNHGEFALLCGPEPFQLLMELGLIEFFEAGGTEPETIAALRIYHYEWFTAHEGEYEITSQGKILDRDGICHDPDDLLSVERAVSGWGIEYLKPGYGDILQAWLDRQKKS